MKRDNRVRVAEEGVHKHREGDTEMRDGEERGRVEKGIEKGKGKRKEGNDKHWLRNAA